MVGFDSPVLIRMGGLQKENDVKKCGVALFFVEDVRVFIFVFHVSFRGLLRCPIETADSGSGQSLNRLGLSGPIWAYRGLPGPIWAYLGQSGATEAYLGPPGPSSPEIITL